MVEAWLLVTTASLQHLSKPRMLDLAQNACPDPSHWSWLEWKGTRADLVRLIEAKRRAHWDAAVPHAPDPKTSNPPSAASRSDRPAVVQISAASCNAWLRTLPRPPLSGIEEDQPDVKKAADAERCPKPPRTPLSLASIREVHGPFRERGDHEGCGGERGKIKGLGGN